MIQFKKIIVHNFGSYQHAELDLQNRGFCLVSGKNNYVADNAASNGTGKSQIFNAICYALTGETPHGVSTKLKRINTEESDDMYVELTFSINNNEYTIKRGET